MIILRDELPAINLSTMSSSIKVNRGERVYLPDLILFLAKYYLRPKLPSAPPQCMSIDPNNLVGSRMFDTFKGTGMGRSDSVTSGIVLSRPCCDVEGQGY